MSEVHGAAVGWEWRRMGGCVGRRGGLGGAEGVEAGAVAVMGRKDGSGCSGGRGGGDGWTEGWERGRGRGSEVREGAAAAMGAVGRRRERRLWRQRR